MVSELSEKYGYLPYMVERYIKFLGLDDTIKLLDANEEPLIPSIRVNTLKIQSLDLKSRLEKKGFKLEPIKWVPYGFKIINIPLNLGSLHEFLLGYFYIQNVASMLPAIILNPKQDETIVDMCAAPGGKATHLAQIMQNKGKLILFEKNEKRIPALELNIQRLGIFNSILLNQDARSITELNIKADKILLDAPCTGEGLIRQDPSRKTSKTINDIEKLSKIQKNLLNAGLKTLKPGGKLLYSTCSIAPEENELVIYDVLKENSNYEIVKIEPQIGVEGLTSIFGDELINDLKLSQRLYPFLFDTIGFFLCLIQRVK